jgi:hypothetical protein
LLDHVGLQVRCEQYLTCAVDLKRRALIPHSDRAMLDVVLMLGELVEQIVQPRERRILFLPSGAVY